MRALACLVAFVLLAIGAVCTVAPALMLVVAQHLITTAGLYAIGAVRIAMGLALLWAAGSSRAPRTLKAFGGLLVIAGLATPLFGIARARAMMDVGSAQSGLLIRVAGVVVVAFGVFIAYAVTPPRPT